MPKTKQRRRTYTVAILRDGIEVRSKRARNIIPELRRPLRRAGGAPSEPLRPNQHREGA
jgi:hypothetical protein